MAPTSNPDRTSPAQSYVFLCYRREDWAYTKLIGDALIAKFGAPRIFWDVDSIDFGVNYEDAIADALHSSAALIAIVGRDWMQTDGSAETGINDPADPVRLEIKTAIEARLPILPILVGGAEMPPAKELPADIGRFAKYNAKRLSQDHWKGDIEFLVGKVEPLLSRADSAPARPAPPRSTAANPSSPRSTPTRRTGSSRPRSSSPATGAAARPAARPPTVPTFGTLQRPFRSTLGDPALRAPTMRNFTLGDTPRINSFDRWINSPEAEAVRERNRAENAARQQAQTTLPDFYERTEFWASAAATIVLCVVAALIANGLATGIARGLGQNPNADGLGLFAWLLGIAWGVLHVGIGALAYQEDPRRGPSAFVTFGILGGWRLFADFEVTAAVLGAFPVMIFIATGVAIGVDVAARTFASIGWAGVVVLWVVTIAAMARYGEEAIMAT